MCGQSICPDAVIYLEPKTRGVAAPAWFAYCLADGGLLGPFNARPSRPVDGECTAAPIGSPRHSNADGYRGSWEHRGPAVPLADRIGTRNHT